MSNPAVSHCSICQHIQMVKDRRPHNCAQVLRAQVIDLRSHLDAKESQLAAARGALVLIHQVLGKDAPTAVQAALRVRGYADRMANLVTAAHHRATRTTVALALRLVRRGGSRREIERSIAALCVDNP
ncbi:hypothetical protein [Pseudomonas sp.]|jgi:hypothetical protein|uniref:hypothetical protein n=1 Tax=Pseudomonas sp. TaxID=306 RepID=UPI002EDAE5AE